MRHQYTDCTWFNVNEESILVTIMVIRGYRYWFIIKNCINPTFIGRLKAEFTL